MKIVLTTVGSRGDVQPMLALALALKSGGHDVLLAGPPERAGWATELGCPYAPIGGDVTTFIDSCHSAHTPAAAIGFVRYVQREIRGQFKALPGLIAGADLVVGASLSFGLASVAEAAKIPYRFIAFTPQLLPSDRHPCPVFKNQRLPAWCNRIGWRIAMAADRFNIARLINHHRRKLGLAPIKDSQSSYLGENVIVATDPPLGGIPPDITRSAIQTGYMHLRQPVPKAPALERFLAQGSPPVYAGFGSMPRADQMALTQVLVKAARSAGKRIVIARPWETRFEAEADKTVFFVRKYPHEKLFPRMAVIVHHGGAGTTATATASGVPQVIVPHILDQYYWGDRVYRAGIGVKAIRRSRLTSRKLGGAIRACLHDAEMRQTALAVRETVRQKDGVKMTVEALLQRV